MGASLRPVERRNTLSSIARQHVPCSCDCIGIYMGAEQKRSAFDSRLQLLCHGPIESRSLERAGHTSRSVTCRFRETSGKRTVRHDWTDAGHHERDRRQQMRADFADSCCGCVVFEL